MSRKSPKLDNQGKAILALFNYTKVQSKMTNVKLEKKFCKADHSGKMWSRWVQGGTQPGIKIVTSVFNYASGKLIAGEWKEIGNESLWTPLLSAVIDSDLNFFADKSKRLTLLNIVKEIDRPLFSVSALRGIEAGYYIPNKAQLKAIFWPTQIEMVWAGDEEELIKADELVTDILPILGLSYASETEIKKFARKFGITGCDNLNDLSEHIQKQISSDALLLVEVLNRVGHIYPLQLKFTESNSDKSAKSAAHSFYEMADEIAFAAHKLQRYSEQINAASNTSRMYGVFERLSYEQYRENGGLGERAGWNFPTLSFY